MSAAPRSTLLHRHRGLHRPRGNAVPFAALLALASALLLQLGCSGPPQATSVAHDPAASLPPARPRPRAGAVGLAPRAAAPPAATPAKVEAVVTTARRYLGVPYRYGGSDRRGLDCSGLVQTVFSAHHIGLPRTASAQFHSTRPIARTQARPGDLVFFGTRSGRVTHVGIYVGGGRFIHASSGRGEVRIDALRERYFRRRLMGLHRVLP